MEALGCMSRRIGRTQLWSALARVGILQGQGGRDLCGTEVHATAGSFCMPALSLLLLQTLSDELRRRTLGGCPVIRVHLPILEPHLCVNEARVFAACILCVCQWQGQACPPGPSSRSAFLPHARHCQCFCSFVIHVTDPQNPRASSSAYSFCGLSGNSGASALTEAPSHTARSHHSHCLIWAPRVSVLFAGPWAFSPKTASLFVFLLDSRKDIHTLAQTTPSPHSATQRIKTWDPSVL